MEALTKKEPKATVEVTKIPYPKFSEGDDVDAFLLRFEALATANDHPKKGWGMLLGSLLSAKTLEVFGQLSESQMQDYESVKEALLRRFGKSAEDYRIKFRESKLEPEETWEQYLVRLDSYLRRWVDLAGTKNYLFLFLKEQFFGKCPSGMAEYLLEKESGDVNELSRWVNKYNQAHPVKSLAKVENASRISGNRGQPDSDSGMVGPRCYNCNKLGHMAKDCHQAGHLARDYSQGTQATPVMCQTRR